MRDPSIHIRKSDLHKILKRAGYEDPSTIVEDIFRVSGKYALKGRGLLIDKAYLDKKMKRETKATDINILSFYKIYSMMVRQEHKYSPKKLKTTDSRRMAQVANILTDAMEFSDNFDLPYEEGYKKYIEIALRKGPSISTLQGSLESTQLEYKAELDLLDGKDIANELKEVYSKYLLSYTGQEYKIDSKPILSKFKKAGLWCIENDIEFEDFIKALFQGLEWKKGIPSPSMFSSDYGKQLVYEYLGSKDSSKELGTKTYNLKGILGNDRDRD
jgi:hypothetical protein